MVATKIADLTLVTQPIATTSFPAVQPGQATVNPRIGKDGLTWLLAKTDVVTVSTSSTLAINDTHLGKMIVLNGSGATISMTSALGTGFWIQLWNLTGLDWTVPTISGVSNHFGSNQGVHTKVKSNARANLFFISVGATLYCCVDGETV